MRSSSSRRRGLFGDVSQLFLLGCLLLFAAVWKASYDMEEASSYLLPRVVALGGAAVAAVELVRGASRRREAIEDEDEGADADAVGGRAGLPVLGSIGFAALYFALIPLLGFVLATGLAVAGFGYVTNFPRKRLVVVLAVVLPIALHLAFVELLKAPLPAGVLGALPF